jgi:NarL family two-component system response regulator LiaR
MDAGVPSAQIGDRAALESEPVTVVLVDDEELIRIALTQSLSAGGLNIVGEARTGEEGLALVVKIRPDVVLIDLQLPGISGVETIRQLSLLAPTSRLLVLTATDDRYGVVEAILAGACGYILKASGPDAIKTAVRASAAGESVISSHIAGDLLDRIRERDIPVTARSEHAAAAIRAILTERELQIFKRLASGESNREIGRVLLLSENTVKNHVASILAKLQLDNRIQAAVQAVRSGIS